MNSAGFFMNGGIRFPTGQLNRVKTDEEPALVAPEGWSTSDTEALRGTLRQVVRAPAQVRLARETVGRALAAAGRKADAADMADSAPNMNLLANDFIGQAANGDYASLRSISSSLMGITRERVVSLLSLR